MYDIPAIYVEAAGVFSTEPQTGAYRGAGRPEATYVVERLVDAAARELGIAPFELRRRNLIPSTAMPYQTALDFKYDCGEFAQSMEKASALADFAAFEQRRKSAAARGKLRGIGICNCIELAGGPNKVLAPDTARVSLMSNGRLRLHTGSTSVGQGHETVFPQLIADQFGVPIEMIDYLQGNTDHLPFGRGNGGSSGMCVGGSAVEDSSAALVTKLKAIAAERMEVTPDTVTLEDGMFRSRDANRTLSLTDLAAIPTASDGVAVSAETTFKPPIPTFPNGTHIAEVEIDPDTGVTTLVAYSAVEDIGRVVHPVLAEGQVQGGVAQGIGQALGEVVVFDELRPAADRLVHGLSDAARRRPAELQTRVQRGADESQPARRKGRWRSGHGRRAGSDDERRERRAGAGRCEKLRHAGNAGAGLECDQRREAVMV